MDSLKQLLSRDTSDYSDTGYSYGPAMGPLLFTLLTLLLIGSFCAVAHFYIRRKRLARQTALLPTHQHQSLHQRTHGVNNFPLRGPNDAVFVYDEKMNLIANSSNPPSTAVPEIRITFPDEENNDAGEKKQGRVVVVHVTDTGSVGMEPLPPYQKTDAERFQSLDLERMGGLREKETSQQRWS